ncbi:MAG: serine hydrolase domain-containing protein [Oceanococcus sp.]
MKMFFAVFALLMLSWSAQAAVSPDNTPLVQQLIAAAQANLLAQAADEDPAPDVDGPIVGMPPLDQLLLGRMDVWMNPVYWSTWVQEAILNGNIQLPAPTDVVRPEIWTPNVDVANGEYISPLPMAVQDISQLTYEWDGATKTVADFVATTETDMINFLVDGVLIGEIYNNGYTFETRHQPWSVTKTFVAATVGMAFEEGLIADLQEPIENYIPDLVGTAWESVTIENILQMESGVHWDEGTPILLVNTQVEQWVQVALDYYSQGQLGQTRNEFLMSLPKVYEQGTEFRYNSGNTQVLAWMLENLYGKPYNEIIAEKLWQPMGAWGDAKMIADREGSVLASQGLYARAYDFARFGEVLRNGGVNSDGVRLLSQEWVQTMVTMTEVSDGGYGYQTWASTAGEGAYKASGFEGQKITVVPKQCVTAVRMAHSFGLEYRNGEFTDPNAYGFTTNFSANEWAAMVKALSEQIGGCADNQESVVARSGAVSKGGAISWMLMLLGVLLLCQRSYSARQKAIS